jgi:hypothetical protein
MIMEKPFLTWGRKISAPPSRRTSSAGLHGPHCLQKLSARGEWSQAGRRLLSLQEDGLVDRLLSETGNQKQLTAPHPEHL